MSNLKKDGKPYPTQAYRKTEVMTANRETILLMLYAGAIRFLRQAIEAESSKNMELKATYIGKTQDIITELRSTLNFDVGGGLATTLDGLYAFVTQRLADGVAVGNAKALNEALDVLSTLNGAWEQAVEAVRKEKAKNEPKAP